PPPPDLRLRLEALRNPGPSVDRATLQRVRHEARHLRDRLGARPDEADDEAAGLLLALAYPDRIAQRRPGQETRYRLRNGRAAVLPAHSALAGADFLVAAHLDGRRAEARVFLAAPVAQADLEQHFADQIEAEETVMWE